MPGSGDWFSPEGSGVENWSFMGFRNIAAGAVDFGLEDGDTEGGGSVGGA